MYVFCVVGEPLNSEAWQWYHAVAGGERCTVVDTWFQTGRIKIYITAYRIAQNFGSRKLWLVPVQKQWHISSHFA